MSDLYEHVYSSFLWAFDFYLTPCILPLLFCMVLTEAENRQGLDQLIALYCVE